MARFYFDVRTPDLISDPEGSELPGLSAAREEAEACAEELARDGERAGQDRDGWVLQVRDSQGWLVATVSLGQCRSRPFPAGLAESSL